MDFWVSISYLPFTQSYSVVVLHGILAHKPTRNVGMWLPGGWMGCRCLLALFSLPLNSRLRTKERENDVDFYIQRHAYFDTFYTRLWTPLDR